MSEGLETLRSIGAQKIHEQTHIARQHAQALLHETFDGMTKIQLLGFISILEREYSVDLSDLKEKAQEFFGSETAKDENNAEVFIMPEKKKSNAVIYIMVALLIFVVASFLTLGPSSATPEEAEVHAVDNSAIENIKETMSQNSTIEDKSAIEKLLVESEPIAEVEKSFKIISKTELWLGYIDLSTHKKNQKLFTGEISLDPRKDWILTLGHGYVNVEIDGEVTEFNDKMNIRLLYKDSKLSKISFEEFKSFNKGSKW